MTKAEFAVHRGVHGAAVSNWIRRGKLAHPALRADGRVNVELADRQLGGGVDSVMAASARARSAGPRREVMSAPSPTEIADMSNSSRLLEARRISAEIKAERDRRELEAERGRYVLAEGVRVQTAKMLSEMILSIEQEFFGTVVEGLGLTREQHSALKRTWRDWRQKFSDHCKELAAAAPEFEGDPEASWGR